MGAGSQGLHLEWKAHLKRNQAMVQGFEISESAHTDGLLTWPRLLDLPQTTGKHLPKCPGLLGDIQTITTGTLGRGQLMSLSVEYFAREYG